MTCCYLCKNSFECSLKRGGVFVPLQDHFEQFCLTDHFIYCNHYQEFATTCGLVPPELHNDIPSLTSRERRFFVREIASFPVTLSVCETSQESKGTSHSKTLAQTVDFSQGGMRVRAAEQIEKQGMLLFNFEEGFIAPLLHGFAEVCWQKFSAENGCCEAGLSFKISLLRQ